MSEDYIIGVTDAGLRLDGLRVASDGVSHLRFTLLGVGLQASSWAEYDEWSGDLPEYFDELAANWRGWSGERAWHSPRGRLSLVALHNGIGQVLIDASAEDEAWVTRVSLHLEPGSLESVSREVRSWFE